MSDLLVRNIPDAVKANLAGKARQGGRSLSDEVKLRLVQILSTTNGIRDDTITPIAQFAALLSKLTL